MAERWSYKIVTTPEPMSANPEHWHRTTEDILDREGAEGWELVTVQRGGAGFLYFMKRRG
jgi:hypothetical protein